MTSATFTQLCDHARETALLQAVLELLEWDERTMLPPAAQAYRADQIAHLSGMVHERHTDARIGDWLAELEESDLASDPHSDSGATIRHLRREYDKRVKLPQSLVEEITRATVLGQQVWTAARQNDDFAAFAPSLAKIVDLKRQQAAAVGYATCAYDALLDDYEPGETTANVTRALAELRGELVPLVAAIADAPRRPRLDILRRRFETGAQEAFGRQVAAAIGFDFQRGRLDVTHHPFCSGLGPDDCRITTRYDERSFPTAFFSILHEAGHGIYDQGLRGDQFGLPPGSFVSLGIHESQSRLWENQVGRSRAFWQHFFPAAQAAFAESLGDVTLDEFSFAINDVRPSLVRVEADEATYNLHIVARFELELALINDDLPVADLPAAWREKYRCYLGVEPTSDADGVLQDIHWSAGLFGYFPTYSLGNLYAAQFFAAADRQLGGLDELVARGDFEPLRQWLRQHIHRWGQCYSAAELVENLSGEALHHQPLLNHLRDKLEPLYGLR